MVGFFKIHHFHRSIAEKGVFMVFISLLHTDLNYKITLLSTRLPLRLFRQTERTICVITRPRTTWQTMFMPAT